MDYKNKCIEIVGNARKELIDIIKSFGVVENLSVEAKRDLGDFVDYMVITKISNGFIYYEPTDLFPNGMEEEVEDLSLNEMYDIIMAVNI
jgi:hypothetical protein